MNRLESTIECWLAYFYNDRCSLVVDIIRHHRITRNYREHLYSRIFFYDRDYYRQNNEVCNYTRYCPRGNGNFEVQDANYHALIETNTVPDRFAGNITSLTSGQRLPLQFEITCQRDLQYRFNAIEPFTRLVNGFYELSHRPSLLNRMAHFIRPAIPAAAQTGIVCLSQEDFPCLKNLTTSQLEFNRRPLGPFNGGALAHHTGWWFPDYLFLVCNSFPDRPHTFLSLSFSRFTTNMATDLTTGYIYFHHRIPRYNDNPSTYKFDINSLSILAYYFEGEGDSADPQAPHCLVIVGLGQKDVLAHGLREKMIKVKLHYQNRPSARVVLGSTQCTTYFDVEIDVELTELTRTTKHVVAIGSAAGGAELQEKTESETLVQIHGIKAILDVKGYELIQPPKEPADLKRRGVSIWKRLFG